MSDDPRLRGFNYGAALPMPSGFGAYSDALRLWEHLDHVRHEASERAWKLSEALRHVRHACTKTERDEATTRLIALHTCLSHYAPENGGDPKPDYSFNSLAGIGDHRSRKGFGYAPEPEDGTEGQDRESYSDDQDREIVVFGL